MASNMDTVGTFQMAKALSKVKFMFYVLHFLKCAENIFMAILNNLSLTSPTYRALKFLKHFLFLLFFLFSLYED